MALREANYVFSRRIADRGNDKIMFDSQDRKIQETDSKDVIWDEIVGKEEHPEFYDGYKFLETDSEAFIRDENCGKEEYPGNCSVIYPSPPCFDEYEDDEWYSWVIGGNRNSPGDDSGSTSRNVKMFADIFDCFFKDVGVAIGGATVVSSCVNLAGGGEIPIRIPQILGKSNADSNFYFGCDLKFSKNLDLENIVVANYLGEPPNICDKILYLLISKTILLDFQIGKNRNYASKIKGQEYKVQGGEVQITPKIINPSDGPFIPTSVIRPHDLPIKIIGSRLKYQASHMGLQNNSRPEIFVLNTDDGSKICNELYGLQLYGYLVGVELFEWFKSIVKLRFKAPFDPGGTSLESGKTNREVVLFFRVMVIMHKNRVDLPFDPGGVGSKAKLEDEFF